MMLVILLLAMLYQGEVIVDHMVLSSSDECLEEKKTVEMLVELYGAKVIHLGCHVLVEPEGESI